MPEFQERSSETSLDKWEISEGTLPAKEEPTTKWPTLEEPRKLEQLRLRCVMFAKPPNLDEIVESLKSL